MFFLLLEGVRSGNIAGSKNLPFKKLLNENWTFKSKEEIQKLYDDLSKKKFILINKKLRCRPQKIHYKFLWKWDDSFGVICS